MYKAAFLRRLAASCYKVFPKRLWGYPFLVAITTLLPITIEKLWDAVSYRRSRIIDLNCECVGSW